MKPKAFGYEMWDPAKRLVIDLEADTPGKLISSGSFSSRRIHVAILPKHTDGSTISSDWLEGLMRDENTLDEWITPIVGQSNTYKIQNLVQVIFRDEGIQTHNGFPQAHIVGPAELVEET